MFFILSAFWWRRIRGLWKLPDGRDWLKVKMGHLIFCWWMRLCSLPVIYLVPNYCGGNEDYGDLLQKVPCTHCCTQSLQPLQQVTANPRLHQDSWTLTGKSCSVSCGVTAPFSWVLMCARFCLSPPRVSFPRTHIRPTMLCFHSFQFCAFIIYSGTVGQVKNFLGIQSSLLLWICWQYLYLRTVSSAKLNK